MSLTTDDPLYRALEAAAGRSEASSVPPRWLAFARRVLRAGQRVARGPVCPVPALRRAEALFAPPAARGFARLLTLVFDSWQGVAPALRGRAGPRLVRYAGRGAALDLEVGVPVRGRRAVRLAAVAPDLSRLRVVVRAGGRERVLALDAAGEARLTLPAGTRALELVLRRGPEVQARTPSLDLG